MFGGPGDDDAHGGVDSDYIWDTGGVDTMLGGDGDDHLHTVDVNGGDTVHGGNDTDTCFVDPDDTVCDCP